jgi:hypothetical protein
MDTCGDCKFFTPSSRRWYGGQFDGDTGDCSNKKAVKTTGIVQLDIDGPCEFFEKRKAGLE